MTAALLQPDWPDLPATVRAVASTRHGGVSVAPWDSLNLGDHVGDDPLAVAENRRRLVQCAGLPREPQWLQQVHGVRVLELHPDAQPAEPADACWTSHTRLPCAVMTADCLPVLFAATDGSCVAAAHAGWRGLVAGVLEATVAALPVPVHGLQAWLGPAIGPQAFEVGDEVRAAFVAACADDARHFRAEAGRWRADLFALARRRLGDLGVAGIGGGDVCTVGDPSRFFSHRRDGRCGRMASVIWRDR